MVRSRITSIRELMVLLVLVTGSKSDGHANASDPRAFGSGGGTKPVPPNNPWRPEKYISMADHHLHNELVARVMDLILDKALFFEGFNERVAGPLNYQTLDSLRSLVDVKLGEQGISTDDLINIFKKVVMYSPHAAHPYMLDKRVSGLDPYALAGDWLAATMSNLVVTYQVAPVWTLMELEMAKTLSDLIGWGGTTRGDGVPTTGAGVANSMALSLALQDKYPKMKTQGLFGRDKVPVIFISEHGSYAFEKAAAFGGVAAKHVVRIKVDKNGRMDVGDLKAKIGTYSSDRKNQLVMVVGTAGTQVLGQMDPLDKIAEVCRQHKLWFHVDGEKGAPLQFLHSKIPGIDKANSVTFGTWLFSTPYVTVMLMTKDPHVLHDSFGLHAPYVWTGLDLYDGSYDTGDHTIQTSRRPEISKFFFMWKARGTKGLRGHLLKIQSIAQYFVKEMSQMTTLFVPIVRNFDLPLISFYVVPNKIHRTNFDSISHEMERVQAELVAKNLLVVSLSSLGNELGGTGIEPHPKFFLTVSLTNSVLERSDVDYILKVIEGVANKDTTRFQPPNNVGLPEATVNSPIMYFHGNFLRNALGMLQDKGIFFSRSDTPSLFRSPTRIYGSVDVLVNEYPASQADLLKLFSKVIIYSPHWGHPYWIYQLAAGLDPYTMVADYLASALNTPMINWKDNPVFTLMEAELLAALRKQVFKSPKGDGIITDGGSMANQMAIGLAKQSKIRKLGDLRANGITGNKKFIVYISEDGHYSTAKGGILQGLGTDNVVNVKADKLGRMRVSELTAMIDQSNARGDIPFMVVITTGTTVYGAIDPVREIVAVCKKYDLWCHIDGMFGGLIVMSDKQRWAVEGIEGADSFGADLHKLFGSAMVCSCLITREEGIFKKTFGVASATDFADPNDFNLSNGGKYWQVDKRNNMFKFWVLWKAKGRVGMGQHVDKIMDNSAVLSLLLRTRSNRGFVPLLQKFEVTNVCFYYVPPSMVSQKINTDEWKEKISLVSFYIEKSLTNDHTMNIVSQKRISSAEKTGTFIKFVLMGSALTKQDLNYLLDLIEYYGKKWDEVERFNPRTRQYIAEHANENRFEPFGNQPPKRGTKGILENRQKRPRYPHPGFREGSKNGARATG